MNALKISVIALVGWFAAMTQVNATQWENALNHPVRSEANKLRDTYRHPQETLQFFGVSEDAKVLEIWPSLGWYSEILAPFLQKNGRYSVAHFHPDSSVSFLKKARAAFNEKVAAHPDVFGQVQIYTLELPHNTVPAATFDHVLTFRNVHNWMRMGTTEAMFKVFYEALRSGGTFGVVEHRAPAHFTEEQQIQSGYVTEAYVKAMAASVGFEFVGGSDVNNNPKDTKDYEQGVWTLPPTLRLGEKDREKYLAIGESDRFTLKFRKP